MTRQRLRWLILMLLFTPLLAEIACRGELPNAAPRAPTDVPATATEAIPQIKWTTATVHSETVSTRPPTSTVNGLQSLTASKPIRTIAFHTPVSAAQTPVTTSHVVRRGETLATIARRYGVAVENLVVWNGIPDPNLIWVGQELVLDGVSEATPTSTDQALSHVVHRGETLASIARRYGVSVENLVVWNGIRNIDVIWAGQVLVVGARPTPARTAIPASTAIPLVMLTPTPPRAAMATRSPTATEPLSVAELKYVRQVSALGGDFVRNSDALIALMEDASREPSLRADSSWGLQIGVALGALELDSRSLESLRAPQRFSSIHGDLLEASRLLDDAASQVPRPLDRLRSSEIGEITAAVSTGRTAVNQAMRQIEGMVAALEPE